MTYEYELLVSSKISGKIRKKERFLHVSEVESDRRYNVHLWLLYEHEWVFTPLPHRKHRYTHKLRYFL